MKSIRIVFLFALGVLLFVSRPASAQSDSPQVLVLNAKGAVTPAMREYIERGLKAAGQRDIDLVILQLNTPGGDLGTTQEIVTALRASTIPVVVYVAPRGAWAGRSSRAGSSARCAGRTGP